MNKSFQIYVDVKTDGLQMAEMSKKYHHSSTSVCIISPAYDNFEVAVILNVMTIIYNSMLELQHELQHSLPFGMHC
jgi:hypothetical protein